ncbi:hypothetical protein DCS_05719 [Drechmeria coniospora]|uniref:Uncharacterized protein n=1 Tax=Drechmeria coniospora TaxID=98403 RepID=A0A151GNX9_DRECN|nr:hypothetical protein DCS_05719 [Drechmeria coniospora]KYK58702.1 hypothetical protein DCS_05719 [Drechmeria coniospora]
MQFESSFLTYLVKVDIRRQSTPKKTFKLNNIGILNNTQTTYCDRFISGKVDSSLHQGSMPNMPAGFVEGGALYARVSIMTSDKTKQREVEQAAEIAFTAYGAEVAVNQKVKSNMERVQKNTNIKVHLHYVGTPSEMKGPAVESKDDELLQVKMRADAFLADAQKHNWKRFARLERYDTIQGFNKFTPIDYSGAIDRSWSVFHDYQSYLSAQHMIRNIPAEKYIGGREIRDQLDDRSSNALETIRNWVSSVNANPSRAKTKPQVENPSRFQGELVSTVQTTRYIGQRLYLRNGGTTDIIDTTLRPRAKQLFVIDAYDFPKIPGTANLIFAGKSNGDQYEVVIGREKTPGYETLRELWVFQKPIRGVVDMAVTVTVIPDGPIITLDYKNPERIFVPVRRALPTTQMSRFFRRQDLTLFSFYVNPVLAKAPA